MIRKESLLYSVMRAVDKINFSPAVTPFAFYFFLRNWRFDRKFGITKWHVPIYRWLSFVITYDYNSVIRQIERMLKVL